MGGARGIPLYAMEYPRFCKQTQIHIHCVWQWHDGKGVASSSDCCVASRVATNDQKADGMHALALLNRELLLSASAALCRTKKKKTFSFYSSGQTEWQAARSVLHAFMLAMTPPTAHSSIRTVKRVHLGKRGRSPRRRRC